MGKVLAILNQKGGVGKTTTALNVGKGLVKKGHKVLFIDLDPQGNLSYIMRSEANGKTSKHVLNAETTATHCIQQTDVGNIIPSSPELLAIDSLLANVVGKEYRLTEALNPIKKKFDFVVLDTPPALSTITVNALTAADFVIVPAQADILSLQGISQFFETAATVKKYCNPKLDVSGIVLTRFSNRTILSRDLRKAFEQVAAVNGTKVFSSEIRESVSLKESQAMRTDVFTYAPKSNGASDYAALIEEFLNDKE